MLSKFLENRKATVKDLQTLCGYLNFLNRAIHPGRCFMRRMYSKYADLWNKKATSKDQNKKLLKPYHHVKLDKEFKADCKIWLSFLMHDKLYRVVVRPMIDINIFETSTRLKFYSDVSAAKELGYGCIFNKAWIFGKWESNLIDDFHPSIEFLELFALCARILTWESELSNQRIIIFCDNMAVVNMINNNLSKCKRCMYLIRILTLNNLLFNRRIAVRHVKSKDNTLSDALSRLKLDKFRKHCPDMNKNPHCIHKDLWPLTKLIQLADEY